MKCINPEQAKKLSGAVNDRSQAERDVARAAAFGQMIENMARNPKQYLAWNAVLDIRASGQGAANEAEIAEILARRGDGDEGAAIKDWLDDWLDGPHYVDDAWSAAGDAIFALLLSDLISEGSFSRAQFAVLVKPWESVFGTIELLK